MSKMKYRLEKNRDIYLGNTRVENLFINEYMPVASGDYVKVYLYGLMYAQNEVSLDLKKEAQLLNMTEADVREALDYWERKNLVRIYEEGEDGESDFLVIEYVSQVNSLYGIKSSKLINTDAAKNDLTEDFEDASGKSDDDEDEDLSDDERLWKYLKKEILNLYHEYEVATGRLITQREMEKLEDLVKLYDINPELISYAIKYSNEKEKLNINYISAVAMNWKKAGCNNLDDVKRHEDKYSKMLAYHKNVFDHIGFTNRTPTEANKEMMNRWITDMGFSIEEVLSACDKAAYKRDPSLMYVDTVLRNKYKELGGVKVDIPRNAGNKNNEFVDSNKTEKTKEGSSNVSKGVLKEYFEYIREKSTDEQNRRIKYVRERIPEIDKIYDKQKIVNDEMLRLGIGSDTKEKRNELREKRKELEARRKQILLENGLPEDYLNRQYLCEKCKDTGKLEDGRNCTCLKLRAEEAYKWNRKRS